MSDPLRLSPSGAPRARGIGIPFDGQPGPSNAITDVPGVEVGYTTRIQRDEVRTGVTAIHLRGRTGAGDPAAAGFHSFNGNGEMTGVSWIAESGTTAGPICITNTHAVGVAHQAVVAWMVETHPEAAEGWLLPVVGETWDGYLNDINGGHVTVADARRAIDSAAGGPVEEGSVGGGTGMNCYHFKGGSGTSSRVVAFAGERFTVGAFVQANFGTRRELVIAGVPVGRELLDDDPIEEAFAPPPGAGSVIGIVATDAPLLPDQCRALARRMTIGIARTGTSGSHFSGDLFLAVSVANPGAFTTVAESFGGAPAAFDKLRFVPWVFLDPFVEAVAQATEEAVLNALVANDEMTGFLGHRTPALPRDRVVELLRARGVLRV
ncbi:MAG: DmpA family aminopeptidase [Actinomycetota bacterium]